MNKIIIWAALLLFSFNGFAQPTTKTGSRKDQKKNRINQVIKEEEEGVIKFDKQFLGGVKLANDGFGSFLEYGKYKSPSRAILFQLDISERKHPKEDKLQLGNNPNPLIFGKINYFYPIKLGAQYQMLLGNKANKNGVQVTANFGGGLSLALLRAYQVEMTIDGKTRSVYYQSADSIYFLKLDESNDAVGPNLFKGWSKVSMTPGAYTKASLRFDYAMFSDIINAIEVGLCAEFYSKKIPQMVYQKQKQFFVSPYIAIMFGKRK